jgi:hypothetical protein
MGDVKLSYPTAWFKHHASMGSNQCEFEKLVVVVFVYDEFGKNCEKLEKNPQIHEQCLTLNGSELFTGFTREILQSCRDEFNLE